ncbi:MAG TPA: WXG100 family type VII secretion target [Planctomycetota bacterium]
MSKAVVDPEELRGFAADLKRFNGEVQAQVATIQRRFVKLGESWQDQEQAKFAESFQKMMISMTKFVEASDKHIPLLLRKAQKIEEYLS